MQENRDDYDDTPYPSTNIKRRYSRFISLVSQQKNRFHLNARSILNIGIFECTEPDCLIRAHYYVNHATGSLDLGRDQYLEVANFLGIDVSKDLKYEEEINARSNTTQTGKPQ